ncbi:DUF421 domain-containing protein [Miltoncostaea marina]|uniref:DUF421 domain-containing protein n=1 Tax=Miltoncostaea marina TaxID=2843215 RepID=UPI001C3CE891|nr:YetF domain-containing protein [Miltoncostaea marina]
MDIILRAAAVFVLLFVVTRVIGRRELGEMEPFDLILLIVMGDLIQQGVTQSDYSFTGAVLAISTLALLTVAVSYASFRWRRVRPLLEGEPIVLIHDGKPVDANLRRERINLEEIEAQARLQQVASLDDVRVAVLETSGQISIIPRSSG